MSSVPSQGHGNPNSLNDPKQTVKLLTSLRGFRTNSVAPGYLYFLPALAPLMC